MKPTLLLSFLLVLSSCGGGSDDSATTASAPSGVYCEGGSSSLTFSSSGATLVKNGYTLETTGTPANGDFTLTGDFEGGMTLEIDFNFTSDDEDGVMNLKILSGSDVVSAVNGIFTKGACPTVDLDGDGITKFVTTNVINPSQIDDISLFRSSAGHDFSDDFESCRSMKHYFEPTSKTNNTNTITAPARLKVVEMNSEEGGGFEDDGVTNQFLGLALISNPAYKIELFHVDVDPDLNLELGDIIEEGVLIGHGRLVRVNSGEAPGTSPSTSNDFDISVTANVSGGLKRISYFDVISDAILADMDTWADTHTNRTWARADFQYSEAARDADPLTCEGEDFTSSGTLPSLVSGRSSF
jgi:hypothetical protein